jgi:hypothetical protein
MSEGLDIAGVFSVVVPGPARLHEPDGATVPQLIDDPHKL